MEKNKQKPRQVRNKHTKVCLLFLLCSVSSSVMAQVWEIDSAASSLYQDQQQLHQAYQKWIRQHYHSDFFQSYLSNLIDDPKYPGPEVSCSAATQVALATFAYQHKVNHVFTAAYRSGPRLIDQNSLQHSYPLGKYLNLVADMTTSNTLLLDTYEIKDLRNVAIGDILHVNRYDDSNHVQTVVDINKNGMIYLSSASLPRAKWILRKELFLSSPTSKESGWSFRRFRIFGALKTTKGTIDSIKSYHAFEKTLGVPTPVFSLWLSLHSQNYSQDTILEAFLKRSIPKQFQDVYIASLIETLHSQIAVRQETSDIALFMNENRDRYPEGFDWGNNEQASNNYGTHSRDSRLWDTFNYIKIIEPYMGPTFKKTVLKALQDEKVWLNNAQTPLNLSYINIAIGLHRARYPFNKEAREVDEIEENEKDSEGEKQKELIDPRCKSEDFAFSFSPDPQADYPLRWGLHPDNYQPVNPIALCACFRGYSVAFRPISCDAYESEFRPQRSGPPAPSIWELFGFGSN